MYGKYIYYNNIIYIYIYIYIYMYNIILCILFTYIYYTYIYIYLCISSRFCLAYHGKNLHTRYLLFEKNIPCTRPCVPMLPFFVLFAFVQWWLRLNSAEHKTTIMNLEIGAFYLPFVFCSAQSHLKTSRPYQTSKHLRNTPLLAEKMVTINKL